MTGMDYPVCGCMENWPFSCGGRTLVHYHCVPVGGRTHVGDSCGGLMCIIIVLMWRAVLMRGTHVHYHCTLAQTGLARPRLRLLETASPYTCYIIVQHIIVDYVAAIYITSYHIISQPEFLKPAQSEPAQQIPLIITAPQRRIRKGGSEERSL